MMSCDTAKEFLSNYIEGTLDDFDRREIEEHLAQCGQCKNTLKQVQFLARRLQSTVPLKTSADFEKKLHARISGAIKDSGFAESEPGSANSGNTEPGQQHAE